MRTQYLYMFNRAGHRESWIQLFGQITGYTPLIGPRSHDRTKKLIAADDVLFASVEDDLRLFTRVALARLMRGKKTRGFFVNPGRAIHGGRFVHKIKYAFLRTCRLCPGIDTMSIIPFYIDPRLERLTTDWFYDPQFWDLSDSDRAPIPCPLVDEIRSFAKDRKILLFLGRMDISKGAPFFVECLRRHPELAKTHAFVAAGKAKDDMISLSQELEDLGGMHINRFLTDVEVAALNIASDTIWACYEPYYNSSSGLFGRALQLGKDVLIREGSYLDIMANELQFPVGKAAYGDTQAVKAHLQFPPNIDPLFDGAAAQKYCRTLSMEHLIPFFDRDTQDQNK